MLSLLLLACASPKDTPDDTGEGPGDDACATVSTDGPPISVVTVDADGRPVDAERVRWLDPGDGSGLWEDAPVARCAEGEPPCAEWVVEGDLPPFVLVAADRRNEAADPEDRACIGWGAIAVTLKVDPARPQRVHLTLPEDALWCDDGATIGPEGIGRFEALDDADCLVVPEAPDGPLRVRVDEPDGTPGTAAWVQWYWPPKSAEYDGEHDLACATKGCAEWEGTDAPTGGDFYVAAMAWGPPVPDYLSGAFWSGYAAGPQVGAAELEVTLAMEWTISVYDEAG